MPPWCRFNSERETPHFSHKFATQPVPSHKPLFLTNATIHLESRKHTGLSTALDVKHIDLEVAVLPGSEIVNEMV